MNSPADIVARALRQPLALASLDGASWDLLVRQARRAGLLARIASILQAQGSLDMVPAAPRAHLSAAIALAEAQHAEALRELAGIAETLAPIGVRPVLLKGSAYVAAGLLPAMGRTFGDIDLLVPRTRLPEVEAALMARGWATTHHSPYDQRYYREWMHELPPLRHVQRNTVLDVHHAILPRTARLKPSSDKLLASAQPLRSSPYWVLCPMDMVLHSMVHLFHNDDLSHALRDLSDLDLLLRHSAREPGFWDMLVARAHEIDLDRPLFLGLRYVARILHTPVPDHVQAAVAPSGPRWAQGWHDAAWERALRPQHPSADDAWSSAARAMLFVRAHWLRMPPRLLMRHLTVKALGLNRSPSLTPA